MDKFRLIMKKTFLISILILGFSCKKPITNNSTATNKRTCYVDYDLDGTKVRYEDTFANNIAFGTYFSGIDLLITGTQGTGAISTPMGILSPQIQINPFGAKANNFPKIFGKFSLCNFSKIKFNEKIYNDTLTLNNLSEMQRKNIICFYEQTKGFLPLTAPKIDTSAINYEGGCMNELSYSTTSNFKDWVPSDKKSYILIQKIEDIVLFYNGLKINGKVITGEIGGIMKKYKQSIIGNSSPFRVKNNFFGIANVSIKFSLPIIVN